MKTLADRKKIIAIKKLCYNCTGTDHRAVDCKSKRNYQNCGGLHSSICDRNSAADPQHSTAAVLVTRESKLCCIQQPTADIFQIQISCLYGHFKINTEVNNVKKSKLLPL